MLFVREYELAGSKGFSTREWIGEDDRWGARESHNMKNVECILIVIVIFER